MEKIMQFLKTEGANVKLEMSGEDLLAFSNDLINRAKAELHNIEVAADKEIYLTKNEVMNKINVCDTTLWHWNKSGYLKAIKIGNKVRYRMSDILKLLGNDGR